MEEEESVTAKVQQSPHVVTRRIPARLNGLRMATAGSYTHKGCMGRARVKCDGTRAETRFGLSGKRKNPFKSAGESVHSTTGSLGVRISGSNGSNNGYTMF